MILWISVMQTIIDYNQICQHFMYVKKYTSSWYRVHNSYVLSITMWQFLLMLLFFGCFVSLTYISHNLLFIRKTKIDFSQVIPFFKCLRSRTFQVTIFNTFQVEPLKAPIWNPITYYWQESSLNFVISGITLRLYICTTIWCYKSSVFNLKETLSTNDLKMGRIV